MPFLGPLLTLVAVYSLAMLFVPNFATMRTFTGILNASVDVGIVTIGITLLMITGEYDLSVGALFAAGGYIFGFMIMNSYSPILAVLLAILLPGLLGGIKWLTIGLDWDSIVCGYAGYTLDLSGGGVDSFRWRTLTNARVTFNF